MKFTLGILKGGWLLQRTIWYAEGFTSIDRTGLDNLYEAELTNSGRIGKGLGHSLQGERFTAAEPGICKIIQVAGGITSRKATLAHGCSNNGSSVWQRLRVWLWLLYYG